MPQPLDIDADRHRVLDLPLPCDHHPVGSGCAAHHQGRERIAGAREAQFVELVEGEIGGLADGDLADVGAAKAARRFAPSSSAT